MYYFIAKRYHHFFRVPSQRGSSLFRVSSQNETHIAPESIQLVVQSKRRSVAPRPCQFHVTRGIPRVRGGGAVFFFFALNRTLPDFFSAFTEHNLNRSRDIPLLLEPVPAPRALVWSCRTAHRQARTTTHCPQREPCRDTPCFLVGVVRSQEPSRAFSPARGPATRVTPQGPSASRTRNATSRAGRDTPVQKCIVPACAQSSGDANTTHTEMYIVETR